MRIDNKIVQLQCTYLFECKIRKHVVMSAGKNEYIEEKPCHAVRNCKKRSKKEQEVVMTKVNVTTARLQV